MSVALMESTPCVESRLISSVVRKLRRSPVTSTPFSGRRSCALGGRCGLSDLYGRRRRRLRPGLRAGGLAVHARPIGVRLGVLVMM